MYDLIRFTIIVLPIIVIGIYIYKQDRNKEPTKLLVKLFVGGFLSCFMVLISTGVLEFIFPFFSKDSDTLNMFELLTYTFIGVALIEENCKWLITYKISYNNREFDEIYDMIVYSTFVALGFAFFENILYVTENGIVTGVVRALSAVPGHACDGVFMGYYLGLAKLTEINNKKHLKNKYLIMSILVPTILHGIYDYCLFTKNIIFIMMFYAFVVWLYIHAVKRIKRMSSITKKMKYNYCSNCGNKINSNYCPHCGKKNE